MSFVSYVEFNLLSINSVDPVVWFASHPFAIPSGLRLAHREVLSCDIGHPHQCPGYLCILSLLFRQSGCHIGR